MFTVFSNRKSIPCSKNKMCRNNSPIAHMEEDIANT